MGKFLRLLAIIASVFIAIAIVADFACRPRTPSLSGPSPVARLEQVTLNGSREWIEIRGADKHNSVLLFLHGGPGMPMMYLGHVFRRPLEQHFTVVQWDRRGAGKSFDAGNGWTPSVRANLDDLHALTTLLRKEFPGRRLILVGHSWGSYLGLLAIRERPDLYDAYVGTGQMASDHKGDNAARLPFFRREAERRGDTKMLDRLAKGHEPDGDDLFAYDAEIVGTHSYWPLLWWGFTAPEYTVTDVMNVPKGASRLEKKMRYDVITGALDQTVLAVKVPVFFILGRHDWNTPSTRAAAYFARLDAPRKRLYWFEQSAHFPFLEERDHFARVLTEIDAGLTARKP
jgi:pimeloyl-ACP methyl ester carboxylesterase